MLILQGYKGQGDLITQGFLGGSAPGPTIVVSPSASKTIFTYIWTSSQTGTSLSGSTTFLASQSLNADAYVPHDPTQAPVTFHIAFGMAALMTAFLLASSNVVVSFYAADDVTHTDVSMGPLSPYIFREDMNTLSQFGNHGLAHDVAYVTITPNATQDCVVNLRFLIESLITTTNP